MVARIKDRESVLTTLTYEKFVAVYAALFHPKRQWMYVCGEDPEHGVSIIRGGNITEDAKTGKEIDSEFEFDRAECAICLEKDEFGDDGNSRSIISEDDIENFLDPV